mgnify:CR=1 FL=1
MSVVLAPRGRPYPAPPAGRPLRLAFVGQGTYFEACALQDGVLPGVRTRFVEFRKDADVAGLRRDLHAFAPHVVVVFRPEIIPAGALADVRAPVVGFLTEPIPRTVSGRHHDLDRRLWELQQVDASGFDRVVSFDPLIASTAADILPVWRSAPLPVADRFYRPVEPIRGRPRTLFVGRSTEHRERMLAPSKELFPELLHMAFGVGAGELEQLGAGEVGARQVGFAQLGAPQVGAAQVGEAEEDVAEIGTGQIGIREVGPRQLSAPDVLDKAGLVERRQHRS